MNAEPEGICEALGWLYGGEWAFDGAGLFTSTSGDWMEFDENHMPGLHRDCWLRDCSDDLAHALEVTAPWEWMDCEPGEFFAQADVNGDILGYVSQHKTVADSWKATTPDGVTHSGSAQSVDAAKTAARAAYLTWMRGRFAMKGCMA